MLTVSIVVGWLSFVNTLGHWSRLGYVKGTIGGMCPFHLSRYTPLTGFNSVSAFYALTFGILGLIPVPKTLGKARD